VKEYIFIDLEDKEDNEKSIKLLRDDSFKELHRVVIKEYLRRLQ
jgi:hypothetical protein